MPILRDAAFSVTGQRQMGRSMRRPQHPFQVRHKPFTIQPFFIAPVLAGETLKGLSWQVRAVTDPIKSRFTGWWLEQYFFYVKLRDMVSRDPITEMLLDPSYDRTANGLINAADRPLTYYKAGVAPLNMDYVQRCLEVVVNEYFRDEGEDYATAGTYLTNVTETLAKVTGTSVLDSLQPEAAVTFDDVNVDLNANATITVGEIEAAKRQYDFLRQNGAIEMTYEDYLGMFGVKVPAAVKAEQHRPELLRFARNWQYPVSAIAEATGAAVSAVQWTIAEKADKDRFFEEPGFLFGVQVARPKVYFRNQVASFTSQMTDAYSWLPAVVQGDARASYKLIRDLAGPLGDVTDANGYWVDLADLYVHGEQFANFTLASAAGDSSVALPLPSLTNVAKNYVSATDINQLFVADSAVANLVRCDGIVQLNIAGRVRDQSS